MKAELSFVNPLSDRLYDDIAKRFGVTDGELKQAWVRMHFGGQ